MSAQGKYQWNNVILWILNVKSRSRRTISASDSSDWVKSKIYEMEIWILGLTNLLPTSVSLWDGSYSRSEKHSISDCSRICLWGQRWICLETVQSMTFRIQRIPPFHLNFPYANDQIWFLNLSWWLVRGLRVSEVTVSHSAKIVENIVMLPDEAGKQLPKARRSITREAERESSRSEVRCFDHSRGSLPEFRNAIEDCLNLHSSLS
jgi:hypothetical protein